jgi:hypothetical protein
MGSSYNFRREGTVGEMVIVDTFTKLIFGEAGNFDELELQIVQSLRLAEPNVALDDHRDMGVYLQALGVSEMIKLVARVQAQMASRHSRPPGRIGSGAGFRQPLGT